MNKKSGHWTNTGMAKFINDNLYNYKSDDEKSMNPFRWYRLQNGDDVSKYRETINGFPCRLILINDGNTPLNEGQNEPTPGNTKDMGIFNFNNDKDNVTTLGFNSDIFPNCASYEVTANSDTSAGAFMSYKKYDPMPYRVVSDGISTLFLPTTLLDPTSNAIESDSEVVKVCFGENNTWKKDVVVTNNDTFSAENYSQFFIIFKTKPTYFKVNSSYFSFNDTQQQGGYIPTINAINELAYLKESFELRHPDEDDVAEDWGFMGVGEEGTGLKALIDWVDNCTDEEFVRDFEQHFHKDYTLRYFCLVTLIGAVDRKNCPL